MSWGNTPLRVSARMDLRMLVIPSSVLGCVTPHTLRKYVVYPPLYLGVSVVLTNYMVRKAQLEAVKSATGRRVGGAPQRPCRSLNIANSDSL